MKRILNQHCSSYTVGAQSAVAVTSPASSGLGADLIQPGPSLSGGSGASVGPFQPCQSYTPDPVVRPRCSWLDDCSGVSWKLLGFRLCCFSFRLRWGLTVQPRWPLPWHLLPSASWALCCEPMPSCLSLFGPISLNQFPGGLCIGKKR